jgi:hypothetical protein
MWDLAFICGVSGAPFTKESFGNAFADACREAGLKGKSAHGIRKIAATRAANSGATVPELEAIFGWRGGRMASLYARSGPTSPGTRQHAQAREPRERKANFYCRTYAEGATSRGRRTSIFSGGADGRSRIIRLNQQRNQKVRAKITRWGRKTIFVRSRAVIEERLSP